MEVSKWKMRLADRRLKTLLLKRHTGEPVKVFELMEGASGKCALQIGVGKRRYLSGVQVNPLRYLN